MISGFIVGLIAPWVLVAALNEIVFPYNIAATLSLAVAGFGVWVILGYYISKH